MPDVRPQNPMHSYDMHIAHKMVHEAPEVREDRIAAAKRALQQGTLTLDANALADRLLADPLLRDDEEI